MTHSPTVIDVESDSETAARRMMELGVRHLPVAEDGEVVGMVWARDLLVLEGWFGQPPEAQG
jgi:CBS domain-containing protein